MEFETNNVIVLTGAGFTKNFGGFLSYEMWGKIFNDPLIQNQPILKILLQSSFDFESVYSNVSNGTNFSLEEIKILKDSIEKAYTSLEKSIRNWVKNDSNEFALDIYRISNLFNHQNGSIKTLFFTLNQDLFMERKLNYITPGVTQFPKEFFYNLERKDFVRLPGIDVADKINTEIKRMSSIVYIKLHGSYGWIPFDSIDNNTAMVIGKNKEKDIEKEPLLKEYYKIFNDTIGSGNKKLLIIGYGFRDEHINNIIKNGVTEHNLSLYIINTITPKEFTEKIIDVHDPIWQAVRGYFSYSLKEIFPLDGTETSQFLEIKDNLLN